MAEPQDQPPIPRIVPVPPVDPITGIIAAIFAVLALLSAIFSGGTRALQGLVTAIRFGFDVTKAIGRAIASAMRFGWAVRAGEFLARLRRLIQVIQDRVTRALEPILKAVRAYRDYFDLIFNRYVVPVLNIIQKFRQVLAIFRLFHLKFAEKLDRQLVELQNRIAEPFEKVRAKLNEVINTIALVMDTAGLLRLDQYIVAAASSIGALIALIHQAQLQFPALPPTRQELFEGGYWTQAGIAARSAAHRAGRLLPEEVEIQRQLRAWWPQLGSGALVAPADVPVPR